MVIILIKTGIAHKQVILPQTIINTFEKCKRERLKVKSDGGGQIMLLLQLQNKTI